MLGNVMRLTQPWGAIGPIRTAPARPAHLGRACLLNVSCADALSVTLLVAVPACAVVRPFGLSDAAVAVPARLLGRACPQRDPGTALEHLAAASAEQLLVEAAAPLGRPCTRRERSGRAEREAVAAAEGADLLVLARDRTRPGPAPTVSARPAVSSSTTRSAPSCSYSPSPHPARAPWPHRTAARRPLQLDNDPPQDPPR
ncbi:hypothetical protein GCM10010357_56430 [Streptomyces luteireticuli]|uniref:Universal stress protein n=1 Tax=Streptomyces luteireticuli TaxID=173858 RepID=A0ABN0Z0X2_9ACTN